MVWELLVSFRGTQTLKKLQTLIHAPLAFNQGLIFFGKETKTVTPKTYSKSVSTDSTFSEATEEK